MIENRVFGTELEWAATISAQAPLEDEPFGSMRPRYEYRKPTDPELKLWLARYLPTYVKRLGEFTNTGCRWYVDCEHPEVSSPELTSLEDLVAEEHAIERTMLDFFTNLASVRTTGVGNFVLNKRVILADGTAWGAHENHQTLRRYFNTKMAEEGKSHAARYRVLAMHFATRGMYAGSGAIRQTQGGDFTFLSSQKLSVLNKTFAGGTTGEKPLVNLRNVPYADGEKYGRLHVVSGDPSLSPWALKLKVGTTKLILDALESDMMPEGIPDVPMEPLYEYAKLAARDTTGLANLNAIYDDIDCTALAVQQSLFTMCEQYVQQQTNPSDDNIWVIKHWKEALDQIENDPTMLLCADWPQRRKTLYEFAERHSLMRQNAQGLWEPDWSNAHIQAVDLKFDQIKDGRSIISGLRRKPEWAAHMPDPELVRKYQTSPPESPPRPKARGMLIDKLANGKLYEYAHVGWAIVNLSGHPAVHLWDPDRINTSEVNAVLGEDIF